MKLSFVVGSQSTVERMPLRLLVLTDLCCQASMSAPAVIETAAGLGELLARLAPAVCFDVPDRISGAGQHDVRLAVRTLRDLAPRSLVAQLPLLERARRLAERIEQTGRSRADAGRLRQLADEHADLRGLAPALQLLRAVADDQQSAARPGDEATARATEPPAPAPAASALDRIMELVDVPGAEQRAASAIGAVVSSVGRQTRARGRGAEPLALAQAASLVRQTLSQQIDDILHHPQCQQLEAAWRGLRFLVDRSDFRGQAIRLDIMHLPRTELREALSERVLAPEQAGLRPFAPSLVLAAYRFDDPAAQADVLQQLADAGEQLQAPVVASVSHRFFGLEQGAEAAQLRYPDRVLEQGHYAKYHSLRGKACARWLVLACNRFLLRAPYSSESSRIGYEEAATGDGDRLWGDPALAIGALVTRSFAQSGWPTEITGRGGGRIDDLPVRPVVDERGRRVQVPLEAHLSADLAADLAEAGFAALQTADNSDSAVLARAPSTHRGAKGEERRGAQLASLPYQLLASRIAQAVAWFRRESALGPQELVRALERFLGGLIADTGAGASIGVTLQEVDEPQSNLVHHRVDVDLRTGRGVLGGASLALAFDID